MKKSKLTMKKVESTLPRRHYTAHYLIEPMHPVTINLIGCGGTGSQVLNSLARMDCALRGLNHPGLFIRAIDPDKVTEANMGRQLFSLSDVGGYKCTALVGKINRFFGLEWESIPELYNEKADIPSANITISCVDSGKARKDIKAKLKQAYKDKSSPQRRWSRYDGSDSVEPYHKAYYWMDFGNSNDRGQMVIGTLNKVTQPKSTEYQTVDTLRCIHQVHPDILKDDKNVPQEPSCSLAEALHKQDLFINTNLANMGLAILWKMFRKAHIAHHGLYLNLDTLTTTPLKV